MDKASKGRLQEKHALVEMIVSLKTVNSTIQLHSNQRKTCNDKKMKLMAKRTDMEHVKRIGFIVGPCLKIATPKTYEEKIYKESQLEKGMIEIKKKITVEQNLKSRVFMVCALEDEAEYIDEQMCETTFTGFKYLSFKLNQPLVRIAAMHANDMQNVKARFETLYGAKIDDEVYKDGKQGKLEETLREQKVEKEPLFIAVEQGSGKSALDVHVAINPRTMSEGKQWLVEECKSALFQNENNSATSVNEELFKTNVKHDDELKSFLQPILQRKGAKKIKNYGKKMNAHAEALGIKLSSITKEKSKEKIKEITKKKQIEKVKEEMEEKSLNIELQNTINSLNQ